MAVDLTGLSIQDLQNLVANATAKANELQTQKQLNELEAIEARKTRINTSVTRLTTLLGSATPAYVPGGQVAPSIRGLNAYTPEILAQNTGIALKLILQGLEELTVTTRDIAEELRNTN